MAREKGTYIARMQASSGLDFTYIRCIYAYAMEIDGRTKEIITFLVAHSSGA